MQSARKNGRFGRERRELIALLLASFACVLVLVAGVTSAGGLPSSFLTLEGVPLIGLLAATGVLALIFIWMMTGTAHREAKRAQKENAKLKHNLASADAIVRSEPQILLIWEQDKPVRIVAQTLTGVPGLPSDMDDFLRFGRWLEPN